tara:strand:+ start:18780 stop:19304 length:525 start_codon:yes stop_codon:yes gene_type:complete
MGRLNKIMLIGNAGNDAELRYTPSGDSVASFNLAVNENYTNREGQQVDQTQWFRISVWGRRSEFVGNYIKKGMQVYAEGRIKSNLYTDNSGETKVSLEVNAYDVQIVQDPQQNSNNPMPSTTQPTNMNPQNQASNLTPPTNADGASSSNEAQQNNPISEPTNEQSSNEDDSLPW